MAGHNPWNESLFGCFDDWEMCFCGCFCIPCLFGQNAEKIDGSNCCLMCCAYSMLSSCYLCWVPHYLKRQILRQKFGLREDPNCSDCCATFFCGPCALCQEGRFLERKGEQTGDTANRSTMVVGPNTVQPHGYY